MPLPESHLKSLERLLRIHDEQLVALHISLQAFTQEIGRREGRVKDEGHDPNAKVGGIPVLISQREVMSGKSDPMKRWSPWDAIGAPSRPLASSSATRTSRERQHAIRGPSPRTVASRSPLTWRSSSTSTKTESAFVSRTTTSSLHSC